MLIEFSPCVWVIIIDDLDFIQGIKLVYPWNMSAQIKHRQCEIIGDLTHACVAVKN